MSHETASSHCLLPVSTKFMSPVNRIELDETWGICTRRAGKVYKAYFLAKFRFDPAENEPAKNLQNFGNFPNFVNPNLTPYP